MKQIAETFLASVLLAQPTRCTAHWN